MTIPKHISKITSNSLVFTNNSVMPGTQRSFDAHVCSLYPTTRKTREEKNILLCLFNKYSNNPINCNKECVLNYEMYLMHINLIVYQKI